jgi:DNA (cytosine-5)-methyltransferase 1
MKESKFPEVKSPLKTLDLFSGCGGFSYGLEKSGCASVKWAIENNEIAAEAFKVFIHKF